MVPNSTPFHRNKNRIAHRCKVFVVLGFEVEEGLDIPGREPYPSLLVNQNSVVSDISRNTALDRDRLVAEK